jgi:hypothetical protein
MMHRMQQRMLRDSLQRGLESLTATPPPTVARPESTVAEDAR